MKIKGIAHIHSNFSDGSFSLEELRERAKKLGMSFVLLAEHSDMLGSSAKYQEFQNRCVQLSDKDFLMISGLEIVVEQGWHILIYNSPVWLKEGISFDKLNLSVKKPDSLVVLAHSRLVRQKPDKNNLIRFDALEVWNAKYDTKHAPCLARLKWLKGSNIKAISGIDAHSKTDLSKLWLEMEINDLTAKNIITHLKQGRFLTCNNYLKVDLNKPIGFFKSLWFFRVNYSFAPMLDLGRFLFKKGLPYPQSLKKVKKKLF